MQFILICSDRVLKLPGLETEAFRTSSNRQNKQNLIISKKYGFLEVLLNITHPCEQAYIMCVSFRGWA